MAHALSDDQVAGELKKMVAFIKQEALEKAREIEIKADEEFAIEKSRLVRAETAAIDTQYERKYKQASLSQQIAQSTVTNKTRLKVLSARQALLDGIFEEARGKLRSISDDEGRYEGVSVNLVLEGLYAMNEPTVELRCRSRDNDIVGRAVEKAKELFKEKTGGGVAVNVDHDWPLPEESHGGIWIIGGNGKISIDNTLEQRLKLLETEALPSVRTAIFGSNPNRRFYD
ncbi:V-type proton ATPase subunit E [Morchella snyderi]|nr:V-type proton ATPase subunit E [Morchella snyderi]